MYILFSHFHLLFKLFIFCRYFATGTTFTALHYDYRLGISTIRKIVLSVCNALWSTLKSEFFPEPTEERWREISDDYRKCSHFPNCLGAIDGKHIRVTKFFLAVVQWILTTSVIFLFSWQLPIQITNLHMLTLGLTEKTAIRLFFQDTSFFKLLIRSKLHIPPSGPVFTSDTENFSFVFVGDEAFSLAENLMRPYAGHNLSRKQRIFNYRLCRARRYVICAFGILYNKWRILHTALNVSKEFSKYIVKACVLLHNVVRSKDGYSSEEIYMTQQWTVLTVLHVADQDEVQMM